MRLLFLIICLALSACQSANHPQTGLPQASFADSIRFAKGFTIERFPEYTLVKVLNPWDSGSVLQRYVLTDRGKPIPEQLPQGTHIFVPVQTTACLNGVDAGFLHIIGAATTVTAIAESQYVRVPEIKARIERGAMASLGEATAVDVEKLIEVSPQIVIVTPFQNSGFGKLEKTGIPLVQCPSYMESSPLGRAEWVKFLAVFYGKESQASTAFDSIVSRYEALATMAQNTLSRPTVLSERKYGPIWYVPGGNSYMATFFRDAGANYLWQNTSESGSIGLPFENVFQQAQNADFWLLKYFGADRDLTYQELEAEYDLYSRFSAFQKKNIWVCNTSKTPYYEEGALEPDVILADMISIFHPELLPEHTRKYFQPLSTTP